MLYTESVIFFGQIEIDPGKLILAVTCLMGKRLKKLIPNTDTLHESISKYAKIGIGHVWFRVGQDGISNVQLWLAASSDLPWTFTLVEWI